MMVFHQVPVESNGTFEADVDRLFDEAIHGSSVWEPKCNVYEDESRFCVQMAVPGLSARDLKVHIDHDTLQIKGGGAHQESEGKTWHVRELEEGEFSSTFQLPSYVNREAVHASYEQGILTVTCPKREEAKSRQVEIQSSPLTVPEREGSIKAAIKAAGLLYAGFVGLGIWLAWRALLA